MLYELKIRDAFQLPPEELSDLAFAPWGDRAEPVCRFQGCLVRDKGFLFDLIAWEKEPLARFTKPGDPVYRDSCLELFCNFDPRESDLYINFEMNANGAYLIGTGSERKDRKVLQTKIMPAVRAAKMDDFWDVMLFVPLECVWEVYGKEIAFCDGYDMKANVYKCGDDLQVPHWLSWSPVSAEKPDFHRPEQFGTFRLKA